MKVQNLQLLGTVKLFGVRNPRQPETANKEAP